MTDHDDSTFEQQLRRALRPIEPPAELAGRIVTAVERARSPGGTVSRTETVGPGVRLPWLGRRAWLSAAAAAVLVVALTGAGALWRGHTQELQARAAHEQVLQALRIANDALDTALEATVNPFKSG
jgi:hypothetical protein